MTQYFMEVTPGTVRQILEIQDLNARINSKHIPTGATDLQVVNKALMMLKVMVQREAHEQGKT